LKKPTILEQPTIFQDSGKAVSLAPKNRIVSTQNIFLKILRMYRYPGTALKALSGAYSALTLLVGRQDGHLACNKLCGGVLPWLSV